MRRFVSLARSSAVRYRPSSLSNPTLRCFAASGRQMPPPNSKDSAEGRRTGDYGPSGTNQIPLKQEGQCQSQMSGDSGATTSSRSGNTYKGEGETQSSKAEQARQGQTKKTSPRPMP